MKDGFANRRGPDPVGADSSWPPLFAKTCLSENLGPLQLHYGQNLSHIAGLCEIRVANLRYTNVKFVAMTFRING